MTVRWGEVSDLALYAALLGYLLAMMAFALHRALGARVAARAVPAGAGSTPGDTALLVADRPAVVPRRVLPVAVGVLVASVALHAAGVVARAAAVGRVPLGNMYEFATAASLAGALVFLFGMRTRPAWAELGLHVSGLLAAILMLALTVLYTAPGELVAALRSRWLAVHVGAAAVAGGAFTVGAVASLAYLYATRPGVEPTSRAATLDHVARAAHRFAFPVWTFAVIAGAIWAERAWGRYWGWDPKEVWAFITWITYAAYLHAQHTAGWKPRSTARIAVAGYVTLVFNFCMVNLVFTGLHSYAGL